MFVVGIDPGLTRCGYCVLAPPASGSDAEVRRGAPRSAANGWRAIAVGVLSTPTDAPSPRRLALLRVDVEELFADYPPVAVAVERVLFQVNVSTAMAVGQASGIVMAEAARRGCEVVEYSPNQVKESVCGYGSADKSQVQEMVRRLLGHRRVFRPADAADAAAVALCHVAHMGAPVPGRAIGATAVGS
ncbi:MAG: crossover junction endodeoxyribonuclease RuvC [Microthrixaceae bacterium]